MHQLDDASFVLRLDPKEMFRLTREFPDQCAKAREIAEGVDLPVPVSKPQLVVLTGLGGSASGGDFTKALFDEFSAIPMFVNRDYHLPKTVGIGTLLFATSYSGNTEETLSAYADAKKAGAQVIVVTSGGKLAELAKQDGFPIIQIPGGQPPRTALGFMLVPVLVACVKLGLLPAIDFDALIAHLKATVAKYEIEVPFEKNPTKQLAEQLHGKLSTLYGLGGWQHIVANRWKCQINENAKCMTFANIFPELCHNEILGWVKAKDQNANWVSIVLEDGSESAKMKKRSEVVARLTADTTETVTVRAEGANLIEKMLSLALYGDFVSLYLAALNGVDPENIDSINILKDELGKISA